MTTVTNTELDSTPTVTAKKANSTYNIPYGGIGRLGYWIGSLVMVLFIILLNFAAMEAGEPGYSTFAALVSLPVSFLLVISRLNNVGKSGWLSLLTLIPIANLYVGITCAVCPEGYHKTKTLDTTGKVLGGICVSSILFLVIVLIVSAG